MSRRVYHIISGGKMAVGKSGKVIVELDPEMKRRLYATLAKDGRTMKEWFVENAQRYMETGGQFDLGLSPSDFGSK